MKKEMTTRQLRAALCRLVGWLTENSTERKVTGMKEICSSAFPAKEDADAAMQVFRAMLTCGWARKNGCNCAAIYTSSHNTPLLDCDQAITRAMEELTPLIEEAGVKVTAESESESLRRIEEIERAMDSEPEPAEPQAERDEPIDGRTETEDNPAENRTNPEEKCEKEDTTPEEKCEEHTAIPWNAIRDLAKSSPAILVAMLRTEGWEVTAKKTITIMEEL